MASPRTRRSSTIRSAINTAVYQAIFDQRHFIDPPKLSPELWERVSIQAPANKAESERLEFLGDALMDACIAIELYKTFPDGNPHKYTEVCSVLHSNFTFSHMVHKMGVTISADTKSIGDVFETMIGAYYTERGFDALYLWVKRAFEPAIVAAANAFDKHQKQKGKQTETDDWVPFQSFSSSGNSGPAASTSNTNETSRRHSVTSTRNAETSHERSTAATPEIRQPSVHNTVTPTSAKPRDFDGLSSATSTYTKRASAASPSPSTSSDSESNSDPENSDDESLPEFWEEVRLPDGKVFYVDHRTETTSWQRPRSRPSRKFKLTDPELSWTARLQAPLPDPPGFGDKKKIPSNNPGASSAVPEHPLASGLIADLLRDGYVLGDVSTSFSHSGSVPDFWEVHRGEDGRTYYIDHPAGTILRSA